MQLAGRYVALNGPEDVASSEAYRRCQEALDPNISYLVDPCRHLLPKAGGGMVTTVVETGKKSLPTLLVLAGIAALWFFGGGREAASEGAREWGRAARAQRNPRRCRGHMSTPVGTPRQRSFCSRMCGMKRRRTGAKTASDPDSCINQSLRRWRCRC